MTEPRDDFPRQLKAALDRHAADAPHTDLADTALREAGRLRTRRRLGLAVAAAAVAGVAIPVGVAVVRDRPPSDHTATGPTASTASTTGGTTASTSAASTTTPTAPVQLRLADFVLGDAPDVPFVEGTTYHGDGATARLTPEADGAIVDVSPFIEGPVVWTHDDYTGLARYSTNGVASGLPRGTASSLPVFDQSTGRTAWAEYGLTVKGTAADGYTFSPGNSDDAVILYTDRLSGPLSAVDTGNITLDRLVGVSDGVVVFDGQQGGKPVVAQVRMTDAAPSVQLPWGAGGVATAVSPNGERLAILGNDTTGPNEARCSAVVEVRHVNTGGWGSCDWRPELFSPDGTRAYAIDTETEGFGPRRAAVLDADTGNVLVSFTTPGTIGRATFEDPDTIDVVVVDGGQSAIVRCTFSGGCELATEPRPAAPDSLVDPYQLTAD